MSELPQMTYAEAAGLYAQLEERAASRRHARRPRRRLTYAVAAGSSVAAAIVVAMVLLGGGSHHPLTGGRAHHPLPGVPGFYGRSGSLNGPRPAPIGSDPFGSHSHRITLARAAILLGAPVPTPDSALANPGNLSAVWGVRGEVILDYTSSQIRISIEPANRILRHGARAAFREMARGLKMSPGFLRINGDPALVVGGGPHEHGFAQVIRDGLSIAVMGERSASQLIAIARSLRG
jgi:hypothetical protein